MPIAPNHDLEDLWREHKKRFGRAPKLDWAPAEIMVKALRAALDRGHPVARAELTGENVVRIDKKKKIINCRVFL